MRAIITGDVHLGSKALDPGPFIEFLRAVPDNEWLILNGDIVNRNCRNLPPEHQTALQEIKELSRRARVTWIRGNHDENFLMPDPAGIEFEAFCIMQDGVGVLHGHDFRHKNLSRPLFVYLLRVIHQLRKNICSEPAYVSFRLRARNPIVRIVRNHIRRNAFSLAAEKELHTVVCGHIHLPEDITESGVRYLNAGTWLINPDLQTPTSLPVIRIDTAISGSSSCHVA